MKMKTSIVAIAVVACGLFAMRRAVVAADAPAKPSGNVSIDLPMIPAALPDGPGKETVAATCVMCHTTRYITMQPPFTRAAWQANVDKMRKVFGAPMSDAQAAEVVNYLVAIRGKDATPAPAAKP
jgi:cytochrome c5